MTSGRAQATEADPYPSPPVHPHGGHHKLAQARLEREVGYRLAARIYPASLARSSHEKLPIFHWVNRVLGNLKTSLSEACDALGFSRYTERYLSATAYCFNRRFDLHALPNRLLVAATLGGPRFERYTRMDEDSG